MKSLRQTLFESQSYSIDWSNYEIPQEDFEMRCEELGVEYTVIPADKVKYNNRVTDWLLEFSGESISKPFCSEAKSLLKSFGIDHKKVEVFRHVAPEAFNYDEVILYTTMGRPTEGEDHNFAVQDIFPE